MVRGRWALTALTTAALGLMGWFLFGGMDAENAAYLWDRRWPRALALAVVGGGLTWGALVLQGALQNRIVTPSILGLDRLFLFVQTLSLVVLGPTGWITSGSLEAFLASTALATVFAGILVQGLLRGTGGSPSGLLLAGLVCGLLLAGLQAALTRILSPAEFSLVQDLGAATLRKVDPPVAVAAVALGAGAFLLVRRDLAALDVTALGRDQARTLGVDWDRSVGRLFLASAAATAAATALAGPLAFYGLVAANLTRQIVGTERHGPLLPAGLALGTALLTAAVLSERVLGLALPFGLIVDLAGGLWLVFILLRENKR